mgnify:CR=1 FL=1|tara:strand:- start:55 stop:348 length:294 start_codon:yes stop_codon:yes gene_type:complete
MSNKSYGLGYERKRKQELIESNYLTNRCRGSFGIFDIVACNKQHLLLESVKSTKQKYYSFKSELKQIREFDNCPAGTVKRLILYHGGKLKILYEDKI